METQYKIINATPGELMHPGSKDVAGTPALTAYLGGNFATVLPGNQQVTNTYQSYLPVLDGLLTNLAATEGKKSFLVFKHNKYITVPTANIAFFHIKYESTFIYTFDRQEYLVNYPLEQIQQLLSSKQFFRLNRQYLVNFDAVKEVEHYFARKLLLTLTIPSPDKLLISKEKTSNFLQWLENR